MREPRWRPGRILGLLLPGLLLAGAALAQSLPEGLRYAPAPAWVDPADLDGVAPAAADGGIAYLLVDDQVRLGDGPPVEYRRLVYEVTERGGLEDGGRLRIGFHPDYETVQVHALAVERDGGRSDRRGQARVELLRVEARAGDGILDGRRTAEILLPDVRVGDRIDMAYSVTGGNPVFGDGYYGGFDAGYGQGAGLRRVRVLAPASKPLAWRRTGPEYTVSDQRRDGWRDLRLEARPLPALEGARDAPGWYDAFGRIDVSTATGWDDVAAWATRLFALDAPARGALAAQARELGLARLAPEQALLEALAFVQREVRYVSLSIGESSHAPASPDTVLERRYGDCKDKSLLLVGLLAEAGIEAEPVLVDTTWRERTAGRLPSPLAFDHAIVRARIDGQWRYLDPTRRTEVGDPAVRSPVRFGRGLPVAAGSTGLVEIPVAEAKAPDVLVKQAVTVAGRGDEARADIVVDTLYRRGEANAQRANFADRPIAEIGSGYLDYMRSIYRDIVEASPPEWTDTPAANLFRVREHYRARFTESDEARTGELNLRLFQLADWIPRGREDRREAPLALGGPESGVHEIRMTVAGGWNVEPEDETVATPWFEFERSVRAEGDTLVVRGAWRRLADAIPAEAYPEARGKLQQARDLLEYHVLVGSGPEGGGREPLAMDREDLAWPAAACAGWLLLLGSLWPVRRRSRFAGMLFRPRETGARVVAEASVPTGMALLVAGAAVAVALEVVPDWLAGAPVSGSRALLQLLGTLAQSLVYLLLLLGAFRLLERRARFAELLVALGWGQVPLLLLMPLALLAAGPALAVLSGEGPGLPTPAWLGVASLASFCLMLLAALAWTLVSVFGATSAAAHTGLGRTIAANALVMAVYLVLAVVLAFGLAATGAFTLPA